MLKFCVYNSEEKQLEFYDTNNLLEVGVRMMRKEIVDLIIK